MTSWEIEGQRWKEEKQSYDYNIASLTKKIASMEYEINRLNEFIDTSNRK